MSDSFAYASLALWLALSLLIVLCLLVISRLVSVLAFLQGQRRLTQNKALIHEYTAASDLSPLEFGYIFDRKLRDNELLALLVTLHRAGLIELKRTAKGLNVRLLVKDAPPKNLDMAGLEMISHLRQAGGHQSWKALSSQINAGNRPHARLEQQIHHELEKKGYIEHGAFRHAALRMRQLQVFFGTFLTILFVLYPLKEALGYSKEALPADYARIDQLVTSMTLLFFAMAVWPFWYLYVKLLLVILYHGSGLPIGATKKLRDEWRRVYGYYVFLRTVEKNRLDIDPNINDPAMPWALAVGAGPKVSRLQ